MKKLALILLAVLLAASPPALAQVQPVGAQTTTPGSMEGTHVFAGTRVLSISVTWHTTAARWLMVFDTTTVPSNGSITAATPLRVCQAIANSGTLADGTQNFDWTMHPILNQFGVAVVVSTNVGGCSAITADGANDFFSGQVQ